MKLSGDPSRYRQDMNGSWRYRFAGTGWWAKVTPKVCKTCGELYVPAYRAVTQQSDNCSRGCGVRMAHKENPGRAKGEKSHLWRGGRHLNPKGYVMAWAPDHPDCQGNKRVYVPEHRLVMEKILGRFLNSNETVHHINGRRDDNRPENLELWVSTQPYGQRAADLVAWAREILEKYGDLD